MTDKVKQMAPIIWEEIQKANTILLHCHKNPDGDSIGSALAMMHALKTLGKEVTVIAGDSQLPTHFACLPGFEEIKQLDYFQIDPNMFDLFIVLDSNQPSRISTKGNVTFPDTMMTVNIDHHADNVNFAKLTLMDSTYPATCQVLFDLFSLWKIEMSQNIATCLFLGIYTDTGGFKYPPTSKETFEIGGKLIETAPQYSKTLYEFENSNSPDFMKFVGLGISKTNIYFNQAAISEVSLEALREVGLNPTNTRAEEISVMLRSVIGWNISISMVELTPGEVRLSMRTREPEKFDLTKLAKALGGGGHKVSAGATIFRPFNEALEILLETLVNVYPFLKSSR